MTEDDALHRFRLRVFGLAHELGSVRAACRVMGIHHSTYSRWQHQLVRFGPEMLRPRERRRPRMPNAIGPLIQQRVVAFALGHPGFGPVRISAELARPTWGGAGSTPPSMSRRPSPGRNCMPRPATRRPGTRAPSRAGWRPTSPAGAGVSSG
jgi:hypothetical protein